MHHPITPIILSLEGGSARSWNGNHHRLVITTERVDTLLGCIPFLRTQCQFDSFESAWDAITLVPKSYRLLSCGLVPSLLMRHIGVNVIGSEVDVANLVQTLEMVFSKHSKVLVVSPPSKANVSDRHDDLTHHNLFLARDALRGCVDLPHAWEEQVQRAIRERFVVVDGKLTT
uniref:Uncharacterized protein n=1 Tax=Ditylum brightwellii TaxID=49249 RepID=A0A6U3TZ36_9STRA|mmetsp:Transcript_37563/g.56198  ORF Transcript_37563/g.56198 Transcript_37563/m.56198 type:complete len:173 (+) Transcript_37563:154-672(+)